MNFNLSEEQTLIKDSIARFVADNYDFEQRNQVAAMEHGFSADYWRQFAELGWLSIPFAEEYGGFGGSAVDVMVIMEELGRAIALEPFLASTLLFGGLVQAGADTETAGGLIEQVIAGELQGALAHVERQSRYALTDIATRASQQGGSWTLSGEKVVVLNGGAAHKLVVAARTGGEQYDARGITLFLVDANANGLHKTLYRLSDGQEAATLRFDDVQAEAVLGEVGEGYALLTPVLDRARLALCANALGAMEALNAMTLEYCKTREQFGVAIGSFQALQHRLVDTFAACENVRSLLYRAVCAADAGDGEAQRSLLALKVMVGKAGRLVGGEAIQLHGGMGMTNELAVGHYVKRLMLADTLFGDADYHRREFMALVNAA